MADSNVVSYIKQQLAAGVSQDGVVRALTSAGWDTAKINEALQEAQAPATPASKPAAPAQPAQPMISAMPARDSQAEAFAGMQSPIGQHELPDFDQTTMRGMHGARRRGAEGARQPKGHGGLIILLLVIVLIETAIIAGVAYYLFGLHGMLSVTQLEQMASGTASQAAPHDSSAVPPAAAASADTSSEAPAEAATPLPDAAASASTSPVLPETPSESATSTENPVPAQ
ncbi:MAG TPA: hypothetical protein VFL98_02210 [Candidatus Paceibacterota bacterium]|nr:hypothetical protein [Candidatus Paceibacterota bacterium]